MSTGVLCPHHGELSHARLGNENCYSLQSSLPASQDKLDNAECVDTRM